MTKRKKILERWKVEIQPSQGGIIGRIHRLGFVYLAKGGLFRYWIFGWQDSWYGVRRNLKTNRWDVVGRFDERRPFPEEYAEANFAEATKLTEELARIEGWIIEPSTKICSMSETQIKKTNFAGSSKAMRAYINKLQDLHFENGRQSAEELLKEVNAMTAELGDSDVCR